MRLPTLTYPDLISSLGSSPGRGPGVEPGDEPGVLPMPSGVQLRPRLVDLRSPSEFARDHLPGALNVPLFEDDQRALVGTLFKQVSPAAAFEKGLSLTRQRLGRLLDQILGVEVEPERWASAFERLAVELRADPAQTRPLQTAVSSLGSFGSQPLILNCWRGGLRSQSVVLLLRAIGFDQAVLLRGGYKAYRQWVMQRVAAIPAELPFLVLRGQTGVGKTLILRALERDHPGTTLDLEGLAGHRSSVLGAVGLQPVTQGAFEGGLIERIDQLAAGAHAEGPWWVEGESRKVGDVVLPAPLFQAMTAGAQVRLCAGMEQRIEQLGQDYLVEDGSLEQTAAALQGLRKKLGGTVVDAMQQQIRGGEWRAAVRDLLELHYDPLYRRDERGRDWLAEFDLGSPELNARLEELRRQSARPRR